MAFSGQVYGSLAQALAALSSDSASTLLYKHLQLEPEQRSLSTLLEMVRHSSDESVGYVIAELVTERKQLRHAAPTRHVFDSRVENLMLWLGHDGWSVQNAELLRVSPAAEEAIGIRDDTLEQLALSGIDNDGAIQRAITDAATAFNANPPDFNDSVVKVRTALESIARRAAATLSSRRQVPYPQDSWGRALLFLRQNGVIDQGEEQMLAQTYTFISPGAHIAGITDQDWARLARTFGVSGCYFILKRYLAAP